MDNDVIKSIKGLFSGIAQSIKTQLGDNAAIKPANFSKKITEACNVRYEKGVSDGYEVTDSNFNRLKPLFSGTVSYDRYFDGNAGHDVEGRSNTHAYTGADKASLTKDSFVLRITGLSYSRGSHWDNCYCTGCSISNYNPNNGVITISAGFLSSMYNHDGNCTLRASVSYEIYRR